MSGTKNCSTKERIATFDCACVRGHVNAGWRWKCCLFVWTTGVVCHRLSVFLAYVFMCIYKYVYCTLTLWKRWYINFSCSLYTLTYFQSKKLYVYNSNYGISCIQVVALQLCNNAEEYKRFRLKYIISGLYIINGKQVEKVRGNIMLQKITKQ